MNMMGTYPQPARVSMKNYGEYGAQHLPWESSSDDVFVLAADLQMRMVAEQEDAYWHAHFAQEPYYVAGRGYDQYRPAYELGWTAALQHPDADLSDLLKELEQQWSTNSATSLLPWREVHQAVREAWLHASVAMRKLQTRAPSMLYGRGITGAVLPLQKKSQTLANELARMRSVPMNDFAQQVLDRYIHLLHSLAQGLKPLFSSEELAFGLGLGGQWPQRLQSQWRRLRANLEEETPEQVFDVCEQRGRGLLFAYQQVLHKTLPAAVRDLLEEQIKRLQSGVDQLSWMRRNWPLS